MPLALSIYFNLWHRVGYFASLDDMFDSLLADKIMGLALDEAVSAFEQHLKNRYGLGLDANMNPGSLDDTNLANKNIYFAFLATP